MATAASRRRSRPIAQDDDDDSDTVRRSDRSPSGSSDSVKRPRLQDANRGHDLQDESDSDNLPRRRGADQVRKPNQLSSRPQFQPGAIVRVSVENFVTYERAEFYPGPNLNMVIGPNGTGKSSLVCAICLGLGYHSNVLGRASAFGEFVKHGQDHAFVEVELQKRPGESSNTNVRLRINREDNGRKFWVNGRESTHKGVQKVTQSLRIQIDNLCQFLPQDKVAEFAGLNSVDLLTKTLQAAAPREMMEWQEKLKELFGQQQETQRRVGDDAEQLSRLESRQESLQADVEKLRERERIKINIEELKEARHLVVYAEARKAYSTAKKEAKSAQNRLKKLQESCAPSLQAVNDKQDYQRQIEAVLRDRQTDLKTAESAADRAVGEVDNAETKLNDLAIKSAAEEKAFTTKKQEIAVIRRKLTTLQAQHKHAPEPFVPADWNTKIREQEHLKREKDNAILDIHNELRKVKILAQNKDEEMQNIKRDMQELDSQQGQLLNQLRRLNPDAARAWDWIKDNQEEFQKEIFGPAMLSCSIKDKRYSNLVQSVFTMDDFVCFTAQTREDHKKLSNQVYKEMGLSVTIRTCTNSYNSYRPPLARGNLAKFGLDGFVTDYLEGPEPVLAMLCAEKKAHTAAVALKDVTEQQYDQILTGEAINSFAAGQQSYRITRRREYGPGATSTRVRQVEQGRFWTEEPIDAAEKTELRRKYAEAKAVLEQILGQQTELKEQGKGASWESAEISKKADEMRKAKGELQAAYTKWQALPDKIELEETTLEQKKDEVIEARSRLHDLESEKDDATIEKAQTVLRYKDKVGAIRTAHQALLHVQILLIEAESEVQSLKDKNLEINQTLETEKRTLKELEGSLEDLKKTASQCLRAAEEAMGRFDKERLVGLSKDRTVEDLDSDIRAEQTRFDVIEAGNPHALAEFERRAADIERLKEEKARRDEELANVSQQITQLRARWEPRLDELVGRINDAFSYNFEQISCAGEVGVHKDEDFDKWAIDIKVRFRENETLQRLDQHRQSGGERAVSTIFYLMSLQSMAQAPFRVVDEINQGMDPRNERLVHERMVEIACREHTSQYFLITPKLLPGLRYDERMRVLCIASGEYMPVGGKKLDFARCVRVQRRLMAAAGA